MMHYILRIKDGGKGSRIDRIESNSLEEAKSFFMSRKQVDEKTFNNLYEVNEDEHR
jgi:hypothetical protein|tara:strand:+ start:99 stop:266 length:168 start_codon:yes stop_codon:yes gene_type:complete